MAVDKYLKKKVWLFISTLVLIVLCAGVWYFTKQSSTFSEDDVVVNTGNLKVIYQNAKDGVKNSLYPLSYQQGNSESPSNIVKIVNKSKLSTKFKVYLKVVNNDENSLDVNKVYYSVDNSDPEILSSKSNFVIYEGKVEGSGEKILDIKFWAGSDLIDNSDAGKTLSLDIEVK